MRRAARRARARATARAPRRSRRAALAAARQSASVSALARADGRAASRGGLARRGEGGRRVGEAAGRQDDAEHADLERPRRVVERLRVAAEPRQPVAEQSGERRRREIARRGEREPREHARLRLAERAPGGILRPRSPSARARPRRGARSAASGVISAAVRPGVSSASRIAHGERQRLLVLVGGVDDRHAGERASIAAALSAWPVASSRSRRQASVDSAGRSASLRKRARAASAGLASPSGRTSSRPTPTIAEQPIEHRLRMAGDADRVAVGIAEHRPGGVVEIAIEVGQHDRALRRARDGRRSAARWRCWRRSSRRRSSARARARRRARAISPSIASAARARAVDEAALGEPVRPVGEGDLEEVEGDAPIGIEAVGDERRSAAPGRRPR